MIVCHGLSKRYREGARERTVLAGLDLEVAAGERLLLLGRSGSGKSTLLNLLAGIDLPSAGEVLVNGIDLPALDEEGRTRFRRRHIGFVYQFFNLIPTLTVAENIRLPLELNGLRGNGAAQQVTRLLTAVGLADRGDSFPDTLSGGEQQRVALARALIHSPALVLADEPTGNLDEQTGRQVLALLGELVASRGTTLVMVSHDPASTGTVDRVLHLEHGVLQGGDAP